MHHMWRVFLLLVYIRRISDNVRGPPLIVKMVLTMVYEGTYHAGDIYAIPVVCPLAGVHQSREEFNRPVASEARSVGDFFHSWILCGTCLCQAQQLIVNASKRALHCLTITAGSPVRHTPVSENCLLPKHDVTERFMALAETQKRLPCISLHTSSSQP
jgi:hypothetical protein